MAAPTLLSAIAFITSALIRSGDGNESRSFEKPRYQVAQSSSNLAQRREVPEVFFDPYSVLGAMSFGVYILYILYSRYQMGMRPTRMGGIPNHGQDIGVPSAPAGGGGLPAAPGGAMSPASNLFATGSQQNLAYLLEVASKILMDTAKYDWDSIGNNSTLAESLDYYDDTSDLPTS